MMMLDDAWWVLMRMCRWANQTEDVKCERALVYLGVQSKLLRASYCLVLATCRRCAKKPVSRTTEEWLMNGWEMGSGLAYPLSGTSDTTMALLFPSQCMLQPADNPLWLPATHAKHTLSPWGLGPCSTLACPALPVISVESRTTGSMKYFQVWNLERCSDDMYDEGVFLDWRVHREG